MSTLEEQNSLIMAEANKILYEKGLWTMLRKYGKPAPTGSYALGLMTWRDLDIYIESNEMTESKFFELGAELASVLKPHRMQYLNEFLVKRDHLPLGFYWGVLIVSPDFPEEWKIDLWAIDSEQLKGFKKGMDELIASIDEPKRLIILEIKNRYWSHPEYRKTFYSVDIYHAVIQDDIKSVREFAGWLEKNRGISS